MYRTGFPVAVVHLALTGVCCSFDFVLYWLLSLVERHGRPGFDATGSDSLELVVDGDGVIVEMLDVFLKASFTMLTTRRTRSTCAMLYD